MGRKLQRIFVQKIHRMNKETYSQARQKALAFLQKKPEQQSFAEAMNILQMAGYKPIFISRLRAAGDNPQTREAAMKNIYSMIRQWAKPEDPAHDDDLKTSLSPQEADVQKMAVIFKDNDKPIGVVIRTFADCYNTRDKLHRQLCEVGEKNDEQSMAERKRLVTAISALSDKMDALWPSIAQFQADATQPSEDIVRLALQKAVPASDSEQAEPEQKEDGTVVVDMIPAMSREELVAHKKNLATRIRRTRNKLTYRSEVPLDKPNPYPPGSVQFVRYTARIEKLQKQLEDVDMAIAKFG